MRRRTFVGGTGLLLGAQAACYGGFNLTRKLHRWNGTFGGKWINWLMFLVLTIIPVYEVCLLVDVLVINSIEFWSGHNPISVASADATVLRIARVAEDRVRIERQGAPNIEVRFGEHHADMHIEGDGPVARIFEDDDGNTLLFDRGGKMTHVYSGEVMQTMLVAARRGDVVEVRRLLDRGRVG